MDENEAVEVVTAGQRLREAREAKGIAIEEIAAQTRIPTRHLISLESSDWDKLPAATYSIGFAKNYAAAVGLDRGEIGEQLRAEMGAGRQLAAYPEIYEAADPARTMPKGLVIGSLALLALVVLALIWLNQRSLRIDAPAPAIEEKAVAPVADQATPPPPPATPPPVVLTATDVVWIEVKDGTAILKQGQLAAGESYAVPSSATAPTLTTGKPEALRISVGPQQAPPIGKAGSTVSGVSLRGVDLLQAASAPIAQPQAASSDTLPAPRAPRQRTSPAPLPASTPDGGGVAADTATPAPGTTDPSAAQQ